jgi:dihydrolipoamide dehydrogenase
LLAAGSEVTQIPSMPFDFERIVSSTEALAFPEVPRRLVIVGGGYIGLELGSVWCRLGSEVTVLEFMPHVLPLLDREIGTLVQKGLEKQGLKFKLSTKVNSAKREGDVVKVSATGPNGDEVLEADRVLVAVGRKPAVVGLGLEEAGVKFDARSGKIDVDGHFQTNVPGVYAIGDLIAGPQLAHKAQEEGVAFADGLAATRCNTSIMT